MPYPTEHAARVQDPGDFLPDTMRSKDLAPGVRLIMGKLKKDGEKGAMTGQSYRFDAAKFTAAEAKAWLKEHEIEVLEFEPAIEKAMDGGREGRVVCGDLQDTEGERSRSWVMVLRYGQHYVNQYREPIDASPETCTRLVDSFRALAERGVGFPVDYQHNTEPGLPPLPPDVTIKAGDIEALETRDDGLWAQVLWTAKATQFIRAGEYNDVSAELWKTFKDPETGKSIGPVLRAIALVARPSVPGMVRVTASDGIRRQEEDVEKNEYEIQVQTLREQAALRDGELVTLREQVASTSKILAEREAELAKLAGERQTLSDRVASLGAEVKVLVDERSNREVTALVEKYEAQGKIVPAGRDAARRLALADRKLFSDLYEAMPVLAQTTTQGGGLPPDEGKPTDLHGLILREIDKSKGTGQVLTYADALQMVRQTEAGRKAEKTESRRSYVIEEVEG